MSKNYTGFPKEGPLLPTHMSMTDSLALAVAIKRAVENVGGNLDWLSFGIAADRPVFGYAPRLYWSTDTSSLSIDVGTSWQTIV